MSHHDETQPPSVNQARIDDEDVEGHGIMRAATEPDGPSRGSMTTSRAIAAGCPGPTAGPTRSTACG